MVDKAHPVQMCHELAYGLLTARSSTQNHIVVYIVCFSSFVL